MVGDLVGEDLAGGDVVAVAEAAGEGEDLVILQPQPVAQEAVDVHAFSVGAGQVERMGGFEIAVGAGGAKDQRAGLHAGIHSVVATCDASATLGPAGSRAWVIGTIDSMERAATLISAGCNSPFVLYP